MIGLIGINHKNASVDERAGFALSENDVAMLIDDWKACGFIQGAVVLSTCNRVEIFYERAEGFILPPEALASYLLEELEQSERLGHKLLILDEGPAVKHLFRLASGLESVVIGETQILGQLKDAFRNATAHGQSTPKLSRLFHRAFEIAKRVRSQFILSSTPLSAGASAVDYVLQHNPSMLEQEILIVGAGLMAESILQRLEGLQAHKLSVYNRTKARAERFAQNHPHITVYSQSQLSEALRKVSNIFVATSASSPVIKKEHLCGLQQKQWIFDLSVPKNVADDVSQLSDVYVYSIDDLKEIEGHVFEPGELEQINKLVDEATEQFEIWSQNGHVREVIGMVQEASQYILAKELATLPSTLSETERELIAKHNEHMRVSYTTAIVSAMRSLGEEGGDQKWLRGVEILFRHILEKEKQCAN